MHASRHAQAAPAIVPQRPEPRAQHAAARAQPERDQQQLPADAVLTPARTTRPSSAPSAAAASRCRRADPAPRIRAPARAARCRRCRRPPPTTRSPVRVKLTASGPCAVRPQLRDHLLGSRSRPPLSAAADDRLRNHVVDARDASAGRRARPPPPRRRASPRRATSAGFGIVAWPAVSTRRRRPAAACLPIVFRAPGQRRRRARRSTRARAPHRRSVCRPSPLLPRHLGERDFRQTGTMKPDRRGPHIPSPTINSSARSSGSLECLSAIARPFAFLAKAPSRR